MVGVGRPSFSVKQSAGGGGCRVALFKLCARDMLIKILFIGSRGCARGLQASMPVNVMSNSARASRVCRLLTVGIPCGGVMGWIGGGPK
jgi:hypothetical protein